MYFAYRQPSLFALDKFIQNTANNETVNNEGTKENWIWCQITLKARARSLNTEIGYMFFNHILKNYGNKDSE